MKKQKVVYLGDIGVPNSASAIHVCNRAELLTKIDMDVYAIALSPKDGKKIKNKEYIRYKYLPPIKGNGKIRGLKWNVDQILGNITWSPLIKELKKLSPNFLILYEVNSVLLQIKLRKYCKRNNIKMIIETTEWMEKEKNRSLAENLLIWQKDIQKKYTDKKCKNIITISGFLDEFYKSQGCNTITIPPTFPRMIDQENITRKRDERCDAKVRLVFAGSLSNKDYLNEILQALMKINKDTIEISFDVIGPSEQEIVKCINENNLTKYGIFVHGRMNHEDVLKIVIESDYSVLLRENKRYAQAGVSTKFCEAMKLGVPSICTKVNGTDLFVKHGESGFLIKNNTIKEITLILEHILSMKTSEILSMKINAYQYAEKYFSAERYMDALWDFLKKC